MLALAVPPLAQRDLLITVTFGVVLLSILLQGLTIKPLLHRLAIVRRHDARQRYDIKRGEIRMTQAALDEIAQLERLHGAPLSLLRELSEEYEARSREAVAAVEALRLERDDLRAEESIRARRQVLIAEKDAVLADFHSGSLSAQAFNALLGSIDARLATLDAVTDRSDREKPIASVDDPSVAPGARE